MLSWASNLVRTPPRCRVPARTPTRLVLRPPASPGRRPEGPRLEFAGPASSGRRPEGPRLASAGAGVDGKRTRRNSTRVGRCRHRRDEVPKELARRNRCWCGRDEIRKELDSNQPAALHGGLTAPRMAAPALVQHRPDLAIYLIDVLHGWGVALSWLMSSPRARAASPRLREPSSDSDPVSPSCESLT